MDENMESKEGLRVTRARTRRQSVLDTDSRPVTPQLESASDRGTASPRPLRRTRLNSATIDLRTPTRTTRRSVARGETPEPITPSASASIRSTRTPAKSARKQLPLQEEEEEPVRLKVEPKSSPLEEESGPKYSPISSGEKRVTRSMSKTPPIAAVKSQLAHGIKTQLDNSLEKMEVQDSTNRASMSPALINMQSKTTEMESEKYKVPATSKLVVKVKGIPLKNAVTKSNELPQEENNALIVDSTVTPMEVDEIDSLDVANTSAKTDNPVAQKVEKALIQSTSLNNLEKTSIPNLSNTQVAQTPESVEENLLETDLVQQDNENLLESSNKLQKIIDNEESSVLENNLKTNTPSENENTLMEKILDSEKVEPVNFIKKTSNLTKQPTEEIDSVTTGNPAVEKDETVSFDVDKHAEEKGVILVDSDNSFKSVEASPKSDKKEFDSKQEVEEFIDEDKSLDFMETESLIDKQVAQTESEETNNNGVNEYNKDAPISGSSVELISNLRLPDVSPDLKKRVIHKNDYDNDNTDELKKSVVFNSDCEDDKSNNKRKFPKTPSREKPPLTASNITRSKNRKGTPLKEVEVKVRHSSTPIQKVDEISLAKSIGNSPQPPAQIDAIQPLVETVEVVSQLSSPRKVLPRRLVSDDEDQEYQSEDENICLYVDNEVEVADDNYQSGDSMESSERREIEENEIPCEGESVGSQDTEDSFADDDSGENDSFIVSDNYVEEDQNTNDIEPLYWENDELDDDVASNTSKDKKQRRRIIVVDSSEDEDAPEINKLNQNDQSCSSNTSKLSEAAKLLNGSGDEVEGEGHGEEMAADVELESPQKINFSESDCLNKTASRLQFSVVDLNSTVEESSDAEPEEIKPVEVKPSTSAAKCEDEEALLAELASSDLTHLQKMFNPLQKARRQSLYLPSSEMMVSKEPKLKRRSDRMLNDFNPSQSFMEMMAERQRQQPKRQRLSKSFCGAADSETLEAIEKAETLAEQKQSEHELSNDEAKTVTKETMKEEEETSLQQRQSVGKIPVKEKSNEYYLKYCNDVLDAANQAKLEQKKQDIAARGDGGKKRKKCVSRAQSVAQVNPPISSLPISPESVPPRTAISGTTNKSKKKVKRLAPDEKQAIQKAVNRAIELLVPDMVQKKPESLARKLSPQPTFESAKAKDKGNKQPPTNKAKQKKQKKVVSPVKSSDEENHHHQQPIERIKTNAGFVTVYKDDSPQRSVIELIKTRSGIVRVEPSTPKPKYFEEVPNTPKSRKRYFHEEAVDQKDRPVKKVKQKAYPPTGSSKAAGGKHSSATESAQRFKSRILARKF